MEVGAVRVVKEEGTKVYSKQGEVSTYRGAVSMVRPLPRPSRMSKTPAFSSSYLINDADQVVQPLAVRAWPKALQCSQAGCSWCGEDVDE